jgi:hypothetical protein
MCPKCGNPMASDICIICGEVLKPSFVFKKLIWNDKEKQEKLKIEHRETTYRYRRKNNDVCRDRVYASRKKEDLNHLEGNYIYS